MWKIAQSSVLTMIALFDLESEQLDVKIVFLHDELEEWIYMHQLDRFIISGNEYHIGLLKKFLNDLEQSPKQWYKMFDTFMILVMTIVGVSMTILLSDGSFIYLFVYLFICLLLYVDDMLIVYKNMSKINTLKTQF